MMGRATRPVVPPIRKIKLDRVYAQPWGLLYPRERKSFGEPLRSEKTRATQQIQEISTCYVAPPTRLSISLRSVSNQFRSASAPFSNA